MKTHQTALGVGIAAAMVLSASAFAATPTHEMPSSTMSPNTTQMASDMSNSKAGSNWFGGPIYSGKPALAATHALVKAGGGAADFKFSTALVAILGQETVDAEVAKLSKQYGKDQTQAFIKHMTFYVNDALKRATEQGIKLPPPADLHGAELAKALVKAGTAPDGTFWSGYFFDQTISHKLHNQVMTDVDAKYGHEVDGSTHKILNQAMYDVAQALEMKNVKRASFH